MASLQLLRVCHSSNADSISVPSHLNTRQRVVRSIALIHMPWWRLRIKLSYHGISSWSSCVRWAYARTHVHCALMQRVLFDWNHVLTGMGQTNKQKMEFWSISWHDSHLSHDLLKFGHFLNLFHRGFCMTCASQLQQCPLCRAIIVSLVKEENESPTSDEVFTWPN